VGVLIDLVLYYERLNWMMVEDKSPVANFCDDGTGPFGLRNREFLEHLNGNELLMASAFCFLTRNLDENLRCFWSILMVRFVENPQKCF
jgi:hypothetical protein